MNHLFLAKAPFFCLYKLPNSDYNQWTVKNLFSEGKNFGPLKGEKFAQIYMDIS